MMRRSKKFLGSGDQEYFKEKRPVNARVDGPGQLAELVPSLPGRPTLADCARVGILSLISGLFLLLLLHCPASPGPVGDLHGLAPRGGQRPFMYNPWRF